MRLALVAAMLAAATWACVIDVRERRIPNACCALTAALGVVLGALDGPAALAGSAACAAALGAALLAMRALLGAESFGMGDVKYLSACALCTGPSGLATLLLAAFGAAGAVALAKLVFGRQNRQETLAFGPFIAFGLVCALAAGPLAASMPENLAPCGGSAGAAAAALR